MCFYFSFQTKFNSHHYMTCLHMCVGQKQFHSQRNWIALIGLKRKQDRQICHVFSLNRFKFIHKTRVERKTTKKKDADWKFSPTLGMTWWPLTISSKLVTMSQSSQIYIALNYYLLLNIEMIAYHFIKCGTMLSNVS
jgi:hypothetical protein